MTSNAKMLLRIFRATFFAMTLTMTLTFHCHFDYFIDIKKMTSLSLSFWKWRHFDVIFGWQWRHQHTGKMMCNCSCNCNCKKFTNEFLPSFLLSREKVTKEKVVARASVYNFSFDHFFPTKQKTWPKLQDVMYKRVSLVWIRR